MPIGVLFALLAYASFSFADATIKGLGGSLSVFEIGFFTTIFSFIPALIVKPTGERWRDALKMTHPWLMQLRGLCGLISSTLVIFAFTTIPLAEVYALVFLTPVFVVILSVILLKEQMSRFRWAMLALGFVGVLIVVRPGFRALEAGHLAAALCAVSASVGAIVLKKVSTVERRTSLLFILLSYTIVFNAVAMIPTFVMPTPTQFAMMMLVGAFAGVGHLTMIAAARNAAANQIAPMQYSQIFWAILLGGMFYNEYPDAIGILGLVLVVTAGIFNATANTTTAHIGARLAQLRARRLQTAPKMPVEAEIMPTTNPGFAAPEPDSDKPAADAPVR
jgi:drug/metabolite transporter (DMT)-like permease